MQYSVSYVSTTALLLSQNGLRSKLRGSNLQNFMWKHAPILFSQQDAQFAVKMGHLDPYIHVDILANPYFVSRWRNGKNSAKNSNCCLLLICSSATQ